MSEVVGKGFLFKLQSRLARKRTEATGQRALPQRVYKRSYIRKDLGVKKRKDIFV